MENGWEKTTEFEQGYGISNRMCNLINGRCYGLYLFKSIDGEIISIELCIEDDSVGHTYSNHIYAHFDVGLYEYFSEETL